MVTHNIPGLEHLEKCDLVILFSRLLSLPSDQMQHIYRYLDSGKSLKQLNIVPRKPSFCK